ncbi:uncharacterized protein STEHIDRAFT_120776 [Stereum hirsutum FP-91666 SS1]|uniref:uncharacterized protein n=1 Tax=Stereum hirsutum (strain FP-91666) TaxID=721885 RepID=UPI000440FBAA|nr:uncharacterized protein STEHIDRAFT_118237 [Stereum hirsutum FP-91666 SS1]XP_007303318.1 uncharacterized protein STEHIDRAFT_120776 [Stereum hirsutum FP-91666 SS1]EIM86996.1 hypothetical protein STEHIDRAFT_120776 [Stereum hirsutum FP-91666 SS1]EIM91062.1 hypothetical protein STEHIDRAFT_118237 [Stereum hirsutum FP-91666 SS1]
MSRRHSGTGGHREHDGLEQRVSELIPLKQNLAHAIENEPNNHRLLTPDALPKELDALSFVGQFRTRTR